MGPITRIIAQRVGIAVGDKITETYMKSREGNSQPQQAPPEKESYAEKESSDSISELMAVSEFVRPFCTVLLWMGAIIFLFVLIVGR